MFCIDRYFCELNLDIINMSRLEHRLSLDPGQDQQSMIVWYGSDRLITIVIKPISDFQLMIYLRHFISPSPIYAQLPPEPGRHSMKYIIIICTFAPSLEKFQRMPIPSYPMKMWWHHQEPIGSRVPESEGHAPLFRKPLLALRLPPPPDFPIVSTNAGNCVYGLPVSGRILASCNEPADHPMAVPSSHFYLLFQHWCSTGSVLYQTRYTDIRS